MTAKEAARLLWQDRCTVYVQESAVNPLNGVTEQREVTAGENIPCRLSFDSSPVTASSGGAPALAQSITLFIGEEVDVPPGSKLSITRQGVTRNYAQSGVPAIHELLGEQQIKLEIWKRWA